MCASVAQREWIGGASPISDFGAIRRKLRLPSPVCDFAFRLSAQRWNDVEPAAIPGGAKDDFRPVRRKVGFHIVGRVSREAHGTPPADLPDPDVEVAITT